MAYYLRGEPISAGDALRLGLIQEVHDHDELLAATYALVHARQPAAGPRPRDDPRACSGAAIDLPWEHSLKLEEFAKANCFSTQALGEAANGLLSARGRPRHRVEDLF
jgi:2-(1,2-epoxy-1,2-dihydrophenyl)acetyl-CoA isomerase